MVRRSRRRAGLLILATLIGAILVTGVRAVNPMARCWARGAFSATRWAAAAAPGKNLSDRGCMVDNLLKKHDFSGWTRDSVIALLGQPPKTDYFTDYDLVYWLGPERSVIRMDSEWLVFRLDSAERVREYRLVTD